MISGMDFKAIREDVYYCVENFMKKNKITCAEDIMQSDRIIENAYEFLIELFEECKPMLDLDKEE